MADAARIRKIPWQETPVIPAKNHQRKSTVKKRARWRRSAAVSQRSRTVIAYRLPLIYVFGWLLLEVGPAFVSPFLGDDAYSTVYFLTEDWATVALALAFYTGLSYTSTILKLAAFMAVCVSFIFAMANFFTESMDPGWYAGLVITLNVLALVLVSIRFAFIPRKNTRPVHGSMYLVIRKPHSLLDMVGLIYSGIGGGFVAYHNGDVWKFSKTGGRLIKAFEPEYHVGKAMIDCGPATPEMLEDMNGLVGQRWSIFNNCFTVFAGWRRKWQT